MSAAVRRVRRKTEKQKISSLATPRVHAGPDNDDIKQKDKVKRGNRSDNRRRKSNSLATQGVQAGPDNDDIKQKDKVKTGKRKQIR